MQKQISDHGHASANGELACALHTGSRSLTHDDVASKSTQEVGVIRQRMQRRLSDNAKLMYEAALDEANPEDSPRGTNSRASVTRSAPSRRSSMDLTRGSGTAAQDRPNRRRSSTNSRRSSLARAAGRRASLAREREGQQAAGAGVGELRGTTVTGVAAIGQGRRTSIARARAVREATAARNECQAHAASASSTFSNDMTTVAKAEAQGSLLQPEHVGPDVVTKTTASGTTDVSAAAPSPAPPAPPIQQVNSSHSAAASLRAFGRRSQRCARATTPKTPTADATTSDTTAEVKLTHATVANTKATAPAAATSEDIGSSLRAFGRRSQRAKANALMKATIVAATPKSTETHTSAHVNINADADSTLDAMRAARAAVAERACVSSNSIHVTQTEKEANDVDKVEVKCQTNAAEEVQVKRPADTSSGHARRNSLVRAMQSMSSVSRRSANSRTRTGSLSGWARSVSSRPPDAVDSAGSKLGGAEGGALDSSSGAGGRALMRNVSINGQPLLSKGWLRKKRHMWHWWWFEMDASALRYWASDQHANEAVVAMSQGSSIPKNQGLSMRSDPGDSCDSRNPLHEVDESSPSIGVEAGDPGKAIPLRTLVDVYVGGSDSSVAAQCKITLRFDDSRGDAPRQELILVADSPAEAARWLRAFSKTESKYATRMASDWLDRTI